MIDFREIKSRKGKIFSRFLLREPSPGLNITLDIHDLFGTDPAVKSSELFLGLIPQELIQKVFTRFGVYEQLAKKGIPETHIRIDTTDPYCHKLWLYFNHLKPESIIAELVLRKCTVNITDMVIPEYRNYSYNLLHIEWLLLQNPLRDFTEERPRLPGQRYPGLGMGNTIMDLLIMTGRALRMDALSNIPNYLHTAFIFTREFKFVDPEKQGVIDALKRDLLGAYSFHKVAWAMVYQAIKNLTTGEYFKWEPEELIYPLSEKLKTYFSTKTYINLRRQSFEKYHFQIDEEKYEKQKQKIGFPLEMV